MRRIGIVLAFANLLLGTDRDVADWVIRQGGNVTIEGRPEAVRELPDLPAQLVVTGVDLVETKLDPKDLVKLSGLKNVRTLLLPGPSFNPAAGSTLDANEQIKALASLSSLEKLHFSLHFSQISTFRIKVFNIWPA